MYSISDSIQLSVAIFSALAVCLLVLGLKNGVSRWIALSKRGTFPPGPKPAFIIGNMFDFPTSHAAECYVEWGKKYQSDILHASSFGTRVIILNSFEDAEELLERRANIYSNRVYLPIVKLMGWEGNMGFMSIGPEWRKHRRIAQQNFRLDALSNQYPIQRRRVHVTLRALLDTPEDIETHIKMLAISVPMASMYGYDIQSLEDPYIAAADRSAALAGQLLMPTYTLINTFPILGRIPAWLPGATAQKMALEAKKLNESLTMEPMELVKKRVRENAAMPSIFSEFLDKKAGTTGYEEDELILARVAQAIYGGASDTMVSATRILIYALATHPEIQKKAQAEVDRVVGRDRLPDFDDRASLPYSDALYRELLRWRPPLTLALPHCVAEDDYYKGYFIPKGTIVFGNVWAMTHNETIYPDPFTFKPERFIKDDGQLNDDNRVLTFGFGRRICPGKYVASSTLWLTIVSILACFDIGKAKDQQGNEIEINHEFEDVAVTSHKKPFKCSIVPRSDTAQTLLDEAIVREQLPAL